MIGLNCFENGELDGKKYYK